MSFKAPHAGHFVPGTQLRHYKGGLYRVVGTCLIEATLKPGVLYQPLQGDMKDITWMRPMAEFQDQVHTPDGVVPRFVVVQNAQATHAVLQPGVIEPVA